jgi:hypothetical protein
MLHSNIEAQLSGVDIHKGAKRYTLTPTAAHKWRFADIYENAWPTALYIIAFALTATMAHSKRDTDECTKCVRGAEEALLGWLDDVSAEKYLISEK